MHFQKTSNNSLKTNVKTSKFTNFQRERWRSLTDEQRMVTIAKTNAKYRDSHSMTVTLNSRGTTNPFRKLENFKSLFDYKKKDHGSKNVR